MTEQGDLFAPSQAGQAQSDVERSLLADLLERSRLYHTSWSMNQGTYTWGTWGRTST